MTFDNDRENLVLAFFKLFSDKIADFRLIFISRLLFQVIHDFGPKKLFFQKFWFQTNQREF